MALWAEYVDTLAAHCLWHHRAPLGRM